MTYQRFEDLPVWQEAIRLAHQVYDLTENPGFKCSHSLRDQLERAALSVSNNIAEGFERGTTNELLQFLDIARGSSGETRSMLCFVEQRKALQGFRPQITKAKSLGESCSRQLRAWADNLQNSKIEGPRRLNNAARTRFQQKQRAEAFRKKLLLNLPPNHPLRKQAEEDEADE
jgi:four helix bundle protein